MIRIVYCPINNPPHIMKIDGSLRAMQKLVDGYIEVVRPYPCRENVIICNEEGKLLGLPDNGMLPNGDHIAGSYFWVKVDGEEFVSLELDEAQNILEMEVFRRIGGKI